MDLRNKHILLISPEPWAGIHMSKHHMAQALAARGNTVVFLDPPSHRTTGITIRKEENIMVVTYRHWFKGINHMPRKLHMWYYRKLITQLAEHCGGPFDILWCFDTSRMQWFPEGMGHRLLHLADYNILHQGMGLVRTADLVLSTGLVVKEHVEQVTGVLVENIGHGLDARWCKNSEMLQFRKVTSPRRVVYAGQLALNYHDWEGWEEIAKAHPELEFKLIGPYDLSLNEPAFHRLRALPNVSFTGLLSKDLLVPELRDADLLFFGFRSNTLAKERANPHKVLEYLSTGNVIVGSWTMEYSDRQDLFCMAQQGAPLLPTFNHALANFEELNAPPVRSQRIAFAQARTVDNLLLRIEELMSTTR